MFNINPHEIKAGDGGLLWQRRYCWKYISADNVPGRPHFCTFIARLFAGLLFGWNRIPVEFEFRFLQPGEWDIGLFHQIFPKKFQLSQVVGGETYRERQTRTLSNQSLTHEKGLESASRHAHFPPENEVELCTNLQIGNSSFDFGCSDVVSPPPSPQLWIYHTLRLGHNNFPSRNWKWGGRGGYLWKGFLLTDGLVVGVKEDSDDVAHGPLFAIGFAESPKDLFLAAIRKCDIHIFSF